MSEELDYLRKNGWRHMREPQSDAERDLQHLHWLELKHQNHLNYVGVFCFLSFWIVVPVASYWVKRRYGDGPGFFAAASGLAIYILVFWLAGIILQAHYGPKILRARCGPEEPNPSPAAPWVAISITTVLVAIAIMVAYVGARTGLI